MNVHYIDNSLCVIIVFTGMEIVGPSWRVFAGFVIEYFWAGGYIAVAGVAYFLRDWRKLQLALSIPLAALFFYIL